MTPPLVLVVEDHADTRQLYTEHLELAGYRVEVAETGDEAVSLTRRHKPRVVVMDLGLPRLDGWDATATLKSAPATKDIYIVAVTGQLERHALDRAHAAGVDALAMKPVSPNELVQLVATGVARGHRAVGG